MLNELEEKLNVYLNELPMPGFNSGKYDLNAVKKFLFPYLFETQPIKFTVKTNSNHASQDRFSQAPGHFELCCASWDSFLTLVTGHLSTNFLLLIYEIVTNNQEDFARYLYQQHCSCVPKIITAAHNLYSTLFYGTGFFWEELTLLVESFPYPSILYLQRQKTFFHKTQWLNMNMK